MTTPKSPESASGKPAKARRAILKDAVPCCAGEDVERARALAPRGEYEIDETGACVGLCSCATHNRFSLSFDAYLQHLNEGRIAVIRG